MLEPEVSREAHKSIIKRFVDVIVLAELKQSGPLSGYDIELTIHRKFHVLVSPGKIYSVLYALERNGLIKGDSGMGKRVYTLTVKGERSIMEIVEEGKSFLPYLSSLS